MSPLPRREPPLTAEGLVQARDRLATPPGAAGSGWLRYGAAMTLWQAGELPPEALEVFRICATLDWEDPAPILAGRGLAMPPPPPRPPPEARLADLLEACDRYLADTVSPGVAESRQALAAAARGPVVPRPGQPNPVVQAHLPAALEALDWDDPGLAAAIAAAVPELDWISYDAYAPGTIGTAFERGHAFAILVGADGPLAAGDFDFGLFLVAPGVFYRDHIHAAPELYLPLTGPHFWRFTPDAPLVEKAAHIPVWNDPFAVHAIKAGTVPLLSLYAWTRDCDQPAEVVPAADWAEIEAQ